MMNEINKTQFDSKQEVTCFSCHRGSPKPLAVPVIAEAPQPLLSEPLSEDATKRSNLPRAADVIAKFITACGGADAIAGITSLEERGTFTAGAHDFPVELYQTNPARSATVIHFSGADRITASDGKAGWTAAPGRPAQAMSAAEADAAHLEAYLQFARDLNEIVPQVETTAITKLGGKDTVALSGRRPGLPPVEMYFDATSGLLVRLVHYLPSALGLNPTQTDYSRYRKIGAVTIPFHWISATPTGRFSIQIESARTNVAVPEKVFSAAPHQD
jgi:hypothetical protein